ncbi:hypothetical protein [Streptomyces sp. NPDC001546]|uniref:hypothetical protein n=1 Tax=Streptomyces sp. NPDC001546 TaxID=3364585 RepID=UPI0036C82F69
MVTVNVRYTPPGATESDGLCLTLHAAEGTHIELSLNAEVQDAAPAPQIDCAAVPAAARCGPPAPRSPRRAAARTRAPRQVTETQDGTDESEPIRYTIAEACDAGIIRKKAGAARQFKFAWIAAGRPFPPGTTIKGLVRYTREELDSVYNLPGSVHENGQQMFTTSGGI